ncbi:MAG: YARHG domain-containing protein [Eubacteriales bacterium]|nr:YARHG domain-containing protein [Eubacteriales bacterium]
MFCKNCGKEIKEGSVFCRNCGTKVADVPVGEQVAQKSEEDRKEAPNTYSSENTTQTTGRSEENHDLIRQIIGSKADYYTAQFDRIRSGEKGKLNWASLILGIMHAGYRGVWKDWLKAVKIPLIVELAAQLLSGVMMFVAPAVGTLFMAVGGLAGIGLFVAQVLFAMKFNRVYMTHVEEKAKRGDGSGDASIARAVLAYIALMAVTLIVMGISSALSAAAVISSIQDYSSYETETDDMVDSSIFDSEETEDVQEEESLVPELEEEAVAEDDTEFEENHLMGIAEFEWTEYYQRTTGPSASIYVSWADENSVMFAIGIGASGYLAYVDLRDCEAYPSSSVSYSFEYPDSGYAISITCMDTGEISITESTDSPFGISLAGEYVPADKADYSTCEYVFPNSSTYELTIDDCAGLSKLECQIARNEIYARYGRTFSDEKLQNYFDSCTWYEGYFAPEEIDNDSLNETERYNLSVIEEYETSMGYR